MCCCFHDVFKDNSKTYTFKNIIEVRKMDTEFFKNISETIKDSPN